MLQVLVAATLIALPPRAAVAQAASSIAPGLAVDAKGNGVVDPTKNVLDLVEAAIRRQDDLRAALKELLQAELSGNARLSELRYEFAQKSAAALADKLESEAKLRAEYAAVLAVAEAKRIDAIRAVDVNAVAVANQRTSEQATALQTQTTASAEVLRNQVARSAEDLRALVATTAATALQNQQQQFAGLSARITTLEQAGSESRGKTSYQDPQIAALVAEVRTLATVQTSKTGADTGQSNTIALLIAVFGFLLLLIGTAVAIVVAIRRPAPARAYLAPAREE